jgi:hypothetical protein
MKTLWRHINYASVVATLALLFALAGGAVAAQRYLINSTGQINPKVLKKLRGRTGPAGRPGVTGAQGSPGTNGSPGAAGAVGAGGTARAYGVVKADGTIVASKTKGLTARSLGSGSYCVTPTAASGVDSSTVQAIATSDAVESQTEASIVETAAASTKEASCPGGWVFITMNPKSTGWVPAPAAFSVIAP